ncbi:MAG: cadherin repeat domain-containing protein, partial [Sphaerospermopsis kisseleviana]
SSTDPDGGNTFTYSLVAGIGDTDNTAFSIVGNQLQINNSPDFETKNNYSIRVKTADQGGLEFDKTFVVTVNYVANYEKYNFTYYYGNGDSYSGYGYAAVGTYTVGQELGGYANETGNLGYYRIDSIVAGTTLDSSYNNLVYVTSYTDADTGFGTTTNIYSGVGYYGLGSESGYAFNATPWTGDYYFSSYSEADLAAVLQVRVNLLADNDGTPGEILANDQVGLNRSF